MGDQPLLFGEPEPEAAGQPKAERGPESLAPASVTWLRSTARPCNLGCGVPIVLASTVKRMRNGTEAPGWMPVDVEPDPHGNIRLHREGRGVRAYVLNKAQREGQGALHLSHMQTCPNRNRKGK